jgi:autotransporter-associated beta strand protein
VTAAFTLAVTNANESPTDLVLTPASVAENAPIGSPVGVLSPTDPDAGETFTYALVSGTGSADNAWFELAGNALRTRAVFDYETRNSYSIRVRVTDASGLSFEKAFTIAVTNVNEPPTAVALSIPDSTPTATSVKLADIAVIDDGVGSNVLTLSGADAGSFQIIGTALYLKAGTSLNAQTKPSYVVTVAAADASLPGTAPVSTTYTLTIVPSGIVVDAGATVTDTAVRVGDYRLVKQGGGTLILDKANTHSGGTVIEAGTIVVKDASALGTGEVRIKAGATLVIDPAAGEAVAGSLVIEEGGFVDLGTGRIRIVAGMTATVLVDALLSGKGDGSWTTSAGIGSSAVSAAVGMGTLRTIGWLDNGDGSFTAGFAAQGDTTMDGAVDILDASNFVTSAKYDTGLYTSWVDGDFNHDGVLDILDATDFFNSALFDQGIYLVSASAPAAMSAMEPVAATAGSTTASAIDSAFAALASDTTATPPKRKNPFASFR